MKLSRLAAIVVAGGVALFSMGPVGAAMGAQPGQRSAPGKVDLRPKFKVGQETRFKMEMESGDNPDAAAGSPQQKQTVGATLLFKCVDTNPQTGSTLEVVYESLKLQVKSPIMNVDFDSSKPAKADDPTDAAIRSIIGMKMSVKMDAAGNITSVDGGGGGLGEAFSAGDLMKGMFGPIFTSKKGNGQANIGDKWTNEDTMEAGMGVVRITTTNTLKSHVGSVATIDITGKFSLDPSSGKGVTIRDSSISGEARWDTEVGMLDSMRMRQRLTVEQAQANGVPALTTQETNVRVQRVGPGDGAPRPGDTKAPAPKEWDPFKK